MTWRERPQHSRSEVVADACAVVAPTKMLGVCSMATNAGKMACYAPMHSGVRMRFGDVVQCLDAAVTGEWWGTNSESANGRGLALGAVPISFDR